MVLPFVLIGINRVMGFMIDSIDVCNGLAFRKPEC